MQKDASESSSESEGDQQAFSYLLQNPIDPTDLSNLPADFRSTEFYKDRQFMRDDEELAHIRSIAASFFNYKAIRR